MKIKLLLICLTAITCLASKNAFAKQDHWGYSGARGPSEWGALNADYKLCKKGKHQSPINLDTLIQPINEQIKLHYQENRFNLTFKPGNLLINPSTHRKEEYITFKNQRYFLNNLHFHTPSEHTLHGKRYAMEAHLVHKNQSGQLLVVGVFLKKGKSNPILKALFSTQGSDLKKQRIAKNILTNPQRLIPNKTAGYFHYTGSLTTPPCTENVTWIIINTPIEASAKEIELFKKEVTPYNARPLQPLNKRSIHKGKDFQTLTPRFTDPKAP